MFLMNAFSLKQYYTEFIEPYYLYIDWSNNSKNIDDNAYIKSITSNPEKLRQETKKLLKKYPNTNKIQYIYEDEIKKGKK
jgi:parvulin-like peptidyl-prolyl isomerase